MDAPPFMKEDTYCRPCATIAMTTCGRRTYNTLPPVAITLFVCWLVICDALVQQIPPRFLHVTPASREELYPPLILLGGIAQTKSSWDHHIPSLARNRMVIVYECLGQGDHAIPSDGDASLPSQARKLLETLHETLVDNTKENDPIFVDIAGFSFGGRVAMASACLQNERDRSDNCIRIRRLHLTGVGCDRSDYGHMAMQSFPDLIRYDTSLRSFAWSILLATYSPGYLRSLPETTLQRFLDHIASSNNPEGLLAILEQAEVKDTKDPYHVTSMAERLDELLRSQSNQMNTIGKLCVGEMDTMAPVVEVSRLQQEAEWIINDVDVLVDSGHAVVLEKPRAWRESVLSFLDDDDSVGGKEVE